jgi:hypothetical protein
MPIADENIPIQLIKKLRELNIETLSVFEDARGLLIKRL